ncbi:MAG TPA: DUF6382 domain-containing protein [Clostridia bacterium]|nr:DUF6382 domain-containing protein [Clostridia bacterium]
MSYLTDLFKFREEGDASSSYIVLELEETENLQNLQLRMIEQNPNPLILPLSYRVLDNKKLIYYNITSKMSLKHFLSKKTLKKSEFIDVLLSMIKILTECKNYYAYDKNFAVDEDLIYVNPFSFEASMIYIPVEFEVDFKFVFKEFIKRIIDNLVQIEEVNNSGFLQNIRTYIRDDSFNLQEFQVLLNRLKMGGNISTDEGKSLKSNRVYGQTDKNQPEQKQTIKAEANDNAIPNIQQPKNKNSFIPDAPIYAESIIEKYPLSSKIIAAGLQVLLVGLIALAYIFYISRQADKVGPLGGMLIISVALDFLVVRKLFDKNRKVTCCVQVKQKQVHNNVNVPDKAGSASTAKAANPITNTSKSKKFNIPGAQKSDSESGTAQKQKGIKILNINKRQIENQSIPPAAPDFSSSSPYDIGNTIILPQSDNDKTVLMDIQTSAAYLTRSQDGVTQRIEINSSNFVIGRIPGQVSYILDNKNVSKIHAAILEKDGKYFIKDLGSRNGTYLNSKKIENGLEYEIANNDKIRFAALEYDFKVS